MRLLVDAPADGPHNMGRDEALLEHVGQGPSPPTLRLYRWAPPTISLGYFQPFAAYEQLARPAGDLAVVRRTTGGGAILHDQEWTYSLVLPSDDPRCRDPRTLYTRVHDAIIEMLAGFGVHAEQCGTSDDSAAHRGPFFCFERRHCFDVVVGDGKMAGSAQRRTPRAILQHGSIILGQRFTQQPAAPLRAHLDVPADEVRAPLLAALTGTLECTLDAGEWSESELRRAAELREKYASSEWTRKY